MSSLMRIKFMKFSGTLLGSAKLTQAIKAFWFSKETSLYVIRPPAHKISRLVIKISSSIKKYMKYCLKRNNNVALDGFLSKRC